MALVEKIKASANFFGRNENLKAIELWIIGHGLHGIDPRPYNDVKAHELEAFGDTSLYPDIEENCMSTSFAHYFQAGYSSGYYSYKWLKFWMLMHSSTLNKKGFSIKRWRINLRLMYYLKVALKIQ
jgi:Zn-dependent oligopeptidase